MTLYSYVVRWDHGSAPNPFYGVCSLATCKPGIRKHAKLGDWVLGTGSAERKMADHAVFLMRVESDTTFDEYWTGFPLKRAVLNGGMKVRFGDNIYHRNKKTGAWIQEDSRHSQHGAVVNETNLKRDTGTTDRVLLSTEFVYWGDQAPKMPAGLAKFHIGQPSYKKFTDADAAPLLTWVGTLNQSGRVGDPIDWIDAHKW
ncbi:hypothetical protein [Mesorhizobium sp. CN2-181]|uniref:Nmad2 family putative nucleotide modification protein n=1 Tax=Mesorhizobium yinganensis TaxID=3157707 RepID=UPI0032B838D4